MLKKILIIEDEEDLSGMYKMKFEQEGFEAIVAENGPEGIAVAKKEKPDLIFLDLVLPDMSGYEILEKLRQNPETKNLKVYILSNLGQNGEIDKSFTDGADGYLVKANLTPSQLVENARKIFGGQKVGVKKNSGVVPAKSKEKDRSERKEALRQASLGAARDRSLRQASLGAARDRSLRQASLGAARDRQDRQDGALRQVQDKGISVLLIEDDAAIVDMYGLYLKKEGYRVEIAKNGAWGIRQAKEKKFDIIIMDMMMPAMNGYQALKDLKKDKETKNVPVIVMSNSAQDEEMAKAKNYGAACYLLKSQITPARLKKEIEKALKIKNKI